MALDIEAINRVRVLMGDSIPPPPEPRPSIAVVAAKKTSEWSAIALKVIGAIAVLLPVLAQFFPRYGKVIVALVAALEGTAPTPELTAPSATIQPAALPAIQRPTLDRQSVDPAANVLERAPQAPGP